MKLIEIFLSFLWYYHKYVKIIFAYVIPIFWFLLRKWKMKIIHTIIFFSLYTIAWAVLYGITINF